MRPYKTSLESRFIPDQAKRILERFYAISKYYKRGDIEIISKRVNLSQKQVQTWFMNKRHRQP